MWYDTEKVEVKWVEDGYDTLGSAYAVYHERLDDFDRAEWRKFLHRDMSGKSVLDLGAWDGRTYHRFADLQYARFVAADISTKLLETHPWSDVEKVVTSMEDVLPRSDNEFDVITTFFVLEHIDNLEDLFSEVYRILTTEGRWIFTFFPQRREFVHVLNKKKFKIKTHPYWYDIIEKIASQTWFSTHTLDIFDHRKWSKVMTGKAYCLMKQ